MASPLSVAEIAYLDIIADQGKSPPEREEVEQFNSPTWILNSPTNTDLLDLVLPYDEAIMEAMTETERHGGDLHHRSYSLLDFNNLQEVEKDLKSSIGYD